MHKDSDLKSPCSTTRKRILASQALFKLQALLVRQDQ